MFNDWMQAIDYSLSHLMLVRAYDRFTTSWNCDVRVILMLKPEGIWTNKCSKMAIALWILRWEKLICFNLLWEWGVICPVQCLLCNIGDESLGHLFLYEGGLVILSVVTNDVLWIVRGATEGSDIHIGDMLGGIGKLNNGSPCWGLHWLSLYIHVACLGWVQ